MAQRYDRIPRIESVEVSGDPIAMVDAINDTISEINRVFQEIGVAQSATRGQDGFSPAFDSNIDMKNNRVTRAARSKEPGDAVTRLELEELGLFQNGSGINFSGPVNFSGSVTTDGSTGGGTGGLPSIGEIVDIVEGIVGAEVPANVSGDPVTEFEDMDRGSTRGTVIMGVDGDGRAAFPRVFNRRWAVSDMVVASLLTAVLQELQELNRKMDNANSDSGGSK